MKRLFSIIMTLLLSLSISVPSSANFSSQNAVGMEINNELIQNALIPENSDVSISRGIYRCEVNADGVNVREQPTTASPSLGMMNKGDIVYSQRIILGEAVVGNDREWHEVICSYPNKGLRGYIYSQYITYLE